MLDFEFFQDNLGVFACFVTSVVTKSVWDEDFGGGLLVI